MWLITKSRRRQEVAITTKAIKDYDDRDYERRISSCGLNSNSYNNKEMATTTISSLLTTAAMSSSSPSSAYHNHHPHHHNHIFNMTNTGSKKNKTAVRIRKKPQQQQQQQSSSSSSSSCIRFLVISLILGVVIYIQTLFFILTSDDNNNNNNMMMVIMTTRLMVGDPPSSSSSSSSSWHDDWRISLADYYNNNNNNNNRRQYRNSYVYDPSKDSPFDILFTTDEDDALKSYYQKTPDGGAPTSCQYDGNCPVRSTCAAAATAAVSSRLDKNKNKNSTSSDSYADYGHHYGRGRCESIVPINSTIKTYNYHHSTDDANSTRLRQQELDHHHNHKDDDDDDSSGSLCIRSCLQELLPDEAYYHNKYPIVEWTADVISYGRPNGCQIIYHRVKEDNTNHHHHHHRIIHRPSIEQWTSERFRYIIRVDPYQPNNISDHRWMAYCYSPCQTNMDCITRADHVRHNNHDHHNGESLLPSSPPPPNSFVCLSNACQRNDEYWQRQEGTKNPHTLQQERSTNANTTTTTITTTIANEDSIHNMVIVSGASGGYFSGLKNLAASVRYWAPDHKMVIYNLGGLKQYEKNEIRSWSNVIELAWPMGIPTHYPPHILEGKKYAWKPIIINETVHKYKSIFWLDAGSTLAGPITPAINIVQRTGMFLVKGQDLDMSKSCDVTYQWFNTTKGGRGPHFSGNTQAYIYPSRYIDSIVIPNAVCAIQEHCISPWGCTLNNHRYDQTTLSILAYEPKVLAPHYTEYLAATKGQLQTDLELPSFKFVWTARQTNKFYINRENRLPHTNPNKNTNNTNTIIGNNNSQNQNENDYDKEREKELKKEREKKRRLWAFKRRASRGK